MADDKVEDRITVPIGLCGITTKDVIDLPSVMFTTRDLTVGVVVGLTTGIGQPLKFITFSELDETEIGINVPTGSVEIQSQIDQAVLEPILEMELLVRTTFAFD